MKQFTITIQDKEGLHARPAGLLSKAAKGFQCAVTLTKGEKTADLIYQRLRLLCAFCAVLLCGRKEKLLVLIQKVVFFGMKQLCQLVIDVPLPRIALAGFIVGDRSEGDSKSFRQFLLLQACLCAGFF